MTISVGPYQFSVNDARATIAHVDDLLDLYPAAAQGALAGRRAELHTFLEQADVVDGDDEPALATAITEVFPKLLEARQALFDSGTVPVTARGIVAQLSTSNGGVPKTPIDTVEVDYGGITSDHQSARKHHGRPWQALCLWSGEIIEQLRDDGHPIFPGAAGENVTVTDLDWPKLVIGTHLRIGSVDVQISAAAEPCTKNARWFSDRDFSRIHHRNGPISRLYATVLKPGTIATGDPVVVEPTA